MEADRKYNLVVIADPSRPFLKTLDNLPPNFVILGTGTDPAAFPEQALAEADIALWCEPKNAPLSKFWGLLPKVKWIHALSAGVNYLLLPAFVESDITLTNAKGVFSRGLAEWAMMACLYFAKNVTRLQEQQKVANWTQFPNELLHGKTLGVIGYGSIGSSTGRLAHAFGMRVLALKRNTDCKGEDAREVDQVYGTDKLHELLQASDYVVVATPLTEGPGGTRGLINAEAIHAMKPNAVLISIGRGQCIDEKAMTQALKDKRIRGAALDVFNQEPLPKESEIWALENVLISPHSADIHPTSLFESMDIFLENCKLLLAGKSLKNVVDKKLGY